jgi:monothiol glutaredoxin
MSSLFDQIRETLVSNDVVLYMKGDQKFPMCGFSNTVVRILETLNIPFHAVNVLKDMELREGIKTFANWPTIPQLYVKEEFIGGCDIVSEMYETGELQALFAEKGIGA